MAVSDDLERLNGRILVLEEWRKDAKEILQKLDSKVEAILEIVRAQQHCPEPGACRVLREQLAVVKVECADLIKRVEKLEKWQTYLTGFAAAVVALWSVIKVIYPWVVKVGAAP